MIASIVLFQEKSDFFNYTLFVSREGAIDRLVGIYKRVLPRCGVCTIIVTDDFAVFVRV